MYDNWIDERKEKSLDQSALNLPDAAEAVKARLRQAIEQATAPILCDLLAGKADGDSTSKEPGAADLVPVDLSAALAEDLPLVQSSKLCAELADEFTHRLSEIKRELSIVSEQHIKLAKRISDSLNRIKLIVTSKDSLTSSGFRMKTFDDYELHKPYGLKDRACDELVESILEAYGHENAGKSRAQRRTLELSSWQVDYVPRSVKELVKYRRVRGDSGLSGEDARPLLLRVRADMRDQLQLEKAVCLKNYFALTPTPSAGEVLAEWERWSDTMPKLISEMAINLAKLAEKTAWAARINERIAELELPAHSAIEQRHQELLAIERRHAFRIRNEKARAFLATPRFDQSLSSLEAESAGRDAAKFGTEYEKNRFIETAAGHCDVKGSNPTLAHTLKGFLEEERSWLITTVSEAREYCLDDCIAVFPRLAVGFSVLEGASTHKDIGLEGLFRTPGFPAWILGWHELRRADLALESKEARFSLCSLGRELVAYGRMQGETVPLPKSLKMEGLTMRLGLSALEAEMLANDPQ